MAYLADPGVRNLLPGGFRSSGVMSPPRPSRPPLLGQVAGKRASLTCEAAGVGRGWASGRVNSFQRKGYFIGVERRLGLPVWGLSQQNGQTSGPTFKAALPR
jgi:hypothetical protein